MKKRVATRSRCKKKSTRRKHHQWHPLPKLRFGMDLTPLIHGEVVQPIPEKYLQNKAQVVAGFSEIAANVNSHSTMLHKASQILQLGCHSDRISWQEGAAILRSGLQYASLYRRFVIPARGTGPRVDNGDLIGMLYEDLIRYTAAVVDDGIIPEPRTGYGRADKQSVTQVARVYEESVGSSKEFQTDFQAVSQQLTVKNWVFFVDHNWFVAFDQQHLFFEPACDKINRSTVEELNLLCAIYRLAWVGHHFSKREARDVLDFRAQRPIFTRDRNSDALWVRIPTYYKKAHLNKCTDFGSIRRQLGTQSKQPGRRRLAAILADARTYRTQLRACGTPNPECWDLVRERTGWSVSTMSSRLGPRPTR